MRVCVYHVHGESEDLSLISELIHKESYMMAHACNPGMREVETDRSLGPASHPDSLIGQ